MPSTRFVIPMRRGDTNDGKSSADGKPLDWFAKSRLVVVCFRDKFPGMYRRDAPTTSRLAESLLLTVAASMNMQLELGDVKHAYFNGHELQREVYLEQP